jgi:hypothetical protein
MPHFNKIHIATYYRVEPEAAVIAGDHIAYDSGIGSNETIVAELRMFTFYGENNGHDKKINIQILALPPAKNTFKPERRGGAEL